MNIGSRSIHTPQQDCLPSSHPIYSQTGEIECYWTGARFGGWIGTLPDASGYSDRLSHWGF